MSVNIVRYHAIARWTWDTRGRDRRKKKMSAPKKQQGPYGGDDDCNESSASSVDEDDVCGICQNPYEGVAPEARYPGDECPVVWGQCGHPYHLACINTWVQSQQRRNGETGGGENKNTCPICRADWEFDGGEDEGESAG
eukprot:CAMPEP_0194316724 /NCGR_PEP_ID=MMETSP0171-20130528/13505_1 /TAXON_ID=218684 /ORGANISM="Corethron pennatum, Strain L29A3" /LENGTH=138 /DNA_ID=CAMNT_0039073069 /DNA_START=116 /DNA_END=532 /DNA_ORIENTATION=-